MQQPTYCECGCGEQIPAKPRRKPARFLPGHHRRVLPSKVRYEPDPEEIPSGLCECGCGGKTTIARATTRKRRHFKGHPTPFVRGHGNKPKGADHHLWKGGRILRRGYVMIHTPDHPRADSKGYVAEHRLVAEKMMDRPLTPADAVHHLNGDRADNRRENLAIITHSEHAHVHGHFHRYRATLTEEELARRLSEAGKKGAKARWG